LRGHIRERSKGSYTITVELHRDYITNKRKQKYFTFQGTKKEAEIFLTEKLREIDTGLLMNTKDIKFGEYLDYWVKEYCETNLSINTIDGYRQYIEKHIKPVLGHVKLEKLMLGHLQAFYSNKLKNGRLNGKGGLSKRTIVIMHKMIHCSLAKALKWQLVVRNVADNVEIPKADKFNAIALNEKQTNLLIDKVKDTELYIPVMIGIYTGMRRGEVLGLTWDNVNLEKGYIRVAQSLYATTQGLQFLPPKTKSSIRTIAIPNSLINILKKHRIKQLESKLRLGELYGNNNVVCCYDDGRLFNPKTFSSNFNCLLKTSNLPLIRFHDLRHSHASLLVKLGIQPKIISERLGHSSIGITMDLYSHLYEETDKEVANMFENLIMANRLTNG